MCCRHIGTFPNSGLLNIFAMQALISLLKDSVYDHILRLSVGLIIMCIIIDKYGMASRPFFKDFCIRLSARVVNWPSEQHEVAAS